MIGDTRKSLQVAIVTTGRFHVCDLARELAALGHHVKFYSLVPPWRTRQFGLPAKCNRWMLPRVAITAVKTKLARTDAAREKANNRLIIDFDSAVSRVIEPCDVMIGMSGMCNQVSFTVKEKYGSQVWIERGSRHILSQKEILESIPGGDRVSDFSVHRELKDYEQADAISVPSRHCEDSFLEYGFSANKLVRNPLGVDLEVFKPTVSPPHDPPTIIMTGTWSLQKGCDTLIAAWRMLPGTKLVHVGPVSDCKLPVDPNFIHYSKVDQGKLVEFYAKAHVFALASRQDGFGMVLLQALACGLRIVCTNRTGGEDLKSLVSDDSAIHLVQPDDARQFANALRSALRESTTDEGVRTLLSRESRQSLSWAAYARRYEKMLFTRSKGCD